MIEEWKIIEENTNYEISNLGRIRNIRNGHILKPNKTKQGYCSILVLTGFKKYTRVLIHRLVAKAFIPNPLNKPCVNHLDYNPSNNCVDNLEWVNQSENNLWSSDRISASAKNKNITPQIRENLSKRELDKSKNTYPSYIYKIANGFRFRLRGKNGKKLIDKCFKTLEETITYKEQWLTEHKEEFETRWL